MFSWFALLEMFVFFLPPRQIFNLTLPPEKGNLVRSTEYLSKP